MMTLEQTILEIIESAASHRVDNWRDMGLPSITMRDAMLMDLGPLIEDFSLSDPGDNVDCPCDMESCDQARHMLARSVLTQSIDFDGLYGTSTDDIKRRFPDDYKTIVAASNSDISESLRSILETITS